MSELVELLRARVRSAPLPKPQLRLVTPATVAVLASSPPRRMDAITRESYVRMIVSLRRFYLPYGMDVLVNQALLGKSSVEDLEDEELVALLRTMDRARDCIAEGISFEEAGLLRSGDDLSLAYA